MTKKTFGVIGVCGANGNLIARILNERGYEVIGTDLSSEEKCRFSKSLDGYDIELFYGETPDEFFEKSDYIVPPASLSKKSPIFKKIDNALFELEDVLDNFHTEKPVFGITGTNGKTTTTTLLKKIAYDNGIEPAEHNLLNIFQFYNQDCMGMWPFWKLELLAFRALLKELLIMQK